MLYAQYQAWVKSPPPLPINQEKAQCKIGNSDFFLCTNYIAYPSSLSITISYSSQVEKEKMDRKEAKYRKRERKHRPISLDIQSLLGPYCIFPSCTTSYPSSWPCSCWPCWSWWIGRGTYTGLALIPHCQHILCLHFLFLQLSPSRFSSPQVQQIQAMIQNELLACICGCDPGVSFVLIVCVLLL